MKAKISMVRGPAIHPNWAKLHAKDSTPDPITPVIMCATADHNVPLYIYMQPKQNSINNSSYLMIYIQIILS